MASHSFAMVVSVILLVVLLIQHWLNHFVTERYMDEWFHMLITQKYLVENVYNYYAPEITTPPGLYIVGAIYGYIL